MELKPYLLFKAQAKSQGPINIALVKYWGKQDSKDIIPLNNSISLTLDMSKHRTETTVVIQEIQKDSKDNNNDSNSDNDEISLTINDQIFDINLRMCRLISLFKAKSPILNMAQKRLKITIISTNTFPMASGCASSASSMSCFVVALNQIFQTNFSKQELSKYARLGSGSACRSIFGGFVEWDKGNNNESMAIQLYKKDHWDLGVGLIIISSKKKDVSSSFGMEQSVKTSDLLKYRVEHIVPQRILEMKNSFSSKNFEQLGQLIMKESNNFHAICRDTYPTINYLTEGSDYVMKCVFELNNYYKRILCAYTFDAGANAFLIYEKKNEKIIVNWFNEVLYLKDSTNIAIKQLICQRVILQENNLNQNIFQSFELFSLGRGAKALNAI